MFRPKISDELEKFFRKNYKNRELIEATKSKIKEICNQDEDTIDHYKNLGNVMSDFKRVHIMKSFVLTFKVVKLENTIYFVKLTHHDDAYK